MSDHKQTKSEGFKRALLAGTSAWILGWSVFWIAMVLFYKGEAGHPVKLAYHLPITWLFCVMGSELLFAIRVERTSLIPFGAAWAVGLVLLYFRLVLKTIDVSGHMTWLSIMIAQSILRRLPIWFTILVVCAYVEAAFLNFRIFGSTTSAPSGIIVGAVLALLMAAAHLWMKRHHKIKVDEALK